MPSNNQTPSSHAFPYIQNLVEDMLSPKK